MILTARNLLLCPDNEVVALGFKARSDNPRAMLEFGATVN
jgi:hypothetical protein